MKLCSARRQGGLDVASGLLLNHPFCAQRRSYKLGERSVKSIGAQWKKSVDDIRREESTDSQDLGK